MDRARQNLGTAASSEPISSGKAVEETKYPRNERASSYFFSFGRLGPALLLVLVPFGRIEAEILFATDGYSLFQVDTASPGVVLSEVPVQDGTGCWTSLAVDPVSSSLYSLTCESCDLMLPIVPVMRELSAETGQALRAFAPDFPPETYCPDVDIGPAGNEARLTSQLGANLRLDLQTELVSVDDPLNPLQEFLGIAHRNTAQGFDTFAVASPNDPGCELARIGGVDGNPPPSTGEVTPIGSCGESWQLAGFDISDATGVAYAAFWVPTGQEPPLQTVLFSIDLVTGSKTELGAFSFETYLITGIAVAPTSSGQALEIPALGRSGMGLLILIILIVGVRSVARTRAEAR